MDIYIVVGGNLFEPSTVIKTFTSQEAANVFTNLCQQYEKTKGCVACDEAWRQSHPALVKVDDGDCFGYTQYFIEERELCV